MVSKGIKAGRPSFIYCMSVDYLEYRSEDKVVKILSLTELFAKLASNLSSHDDI
jgi:hypothetical protein